jgi:PAS domain S-box-containing protein
MGYKLIKEHYDELLEILDCIKVGIYITDGNGNTVMLNKESEKTGGMTREELLGKNMRELIKIGYVEESSALKVIKSHREENIIQNLGDGGQLYITGVPLIKNDRLDLVVCTERDITEIINLRELLKEKEEIAEKYETELEYRREREINSEGEIIADSRAMRTVIEKALRIARLDTTVLLTGESGTGKELVANLIYKNSLRKKQPFIKVNCAAVPGNLLESEFFGYEEGSFTGASRQGKIGIFELANRGTLFLDEIGEIPIQMQSKLLRVLQEKEIMRIGGKETIPIDVRIIAATNINLKKAIEEGKFRDDLYYRLNIIPIDIPPLRERKEDIGKLTRYFVEKFNREYKLNKNISDDVIELLEAYHWPGNVRELKNIIERVVVGFDGPNITRFQVQRQLINDRPEEIDIAETEHTGSLKEIMDDYEKRILIDYMRKYNNASEVARILKVNKSTISRKLSKYNIRI